MTFVVPAIIEDASDARDAVLDFLRLTPDPFSMWSSTLRQPFDVAKNVMAGLNNDPGLGPVLKAVPHGGASYLVGRPKIPAGRTSVSVVLPADGPSAGSPGGWGSVRTQGPVVPYALAEVVAASAIAFALAERCSEVADAGGQARELSWLRDEAGELETFAVRLEDQIVDLADQWRAATEQRNGKPVPPPPATKPVNLR